MIQQILGSYELNSHAHPKINEITFNFLEFASVRKNSVPPSIQSWDTTNFRVLSPILTMPTQKYFDCLLIYVNLYQHANNQVISYWLALEIWLIKKPRNLIGYEHFELYLRDLPIYGIWAGTQQIIEIFITEQISKNEQIFNKL